MEVELSTKSAAAVCLKSGQPATNATVISNTQQSAAIPSSGNNFSDYSMSDKLTSLMVSSMLREPPAYHSRHHRTHSNKDENEEMEDDEEDDDEEDEDEDFGDIQFFHQHHRRQLMLQQQQQQKSNVKNNSVSSFLSKDSEIEDANSLAAATNSIPNALLSVANFNFNGSNSSNSSGDSNLSQQENPFVFPDNVMEYGEPQFFPGNCVGYLETILEETDEEYEEEEGCSGRHWWTADSDTDTDSVIRVDPTAAAAVAVASSLINPNPNYLNGKSKSAEEPLISLNKSPFRTSASSRPFELEDLHLLDQLDLAFEETLMEPRRRTGFAFGHQLHLLEQSLVTAGKNTPGQKEIAESIKPETKIQGDISNICTSTITATASAPNLHKEVEKDESEQMSTLLNDKDEVQVEDSTEECLAVETGSKVEKMESTFHNNECDASGCSSESSEAPAEIAEEDFFYSSPSEGSEEEESNHSTTEEETSSSDDSDKNGVVLAEFSLNSAGNGLLGNDGSAGLGAATGFNLGLYGSGRHSNRRAFESQSSRLRSFRSFDSLNSLAGTELLFSKAETFPSFHYIKEVAEPGCSGDVPGAGSGESQSLPLHHSLPHNSSEEDCFAVSGGNKKISKKNSSSSSTSTSTSTSAEGVEGMSTENLSEDSGIGTEGSGLRNLLPLPKLQGSQNPLEDCIIGGSSSNIVTSGVVGVGSIGNGTCCDSQQQQPQSFSSCSSANEYIAKSEFALNPFVYSSLSDQETSMSMTSVNNPSTCPSDPDFNGYNNNNSSLDSNLDKSARPPPPSLFHSQPFLSEKEEEGKENHSENKHNMTHSSNKTDTAINTGSLIEEKAVATDISSESMQTYNKPAFIHSDSCGAVGTSANSYSSEEQTNVAKGCKTNDGILPECGLHPQSTTFHSNLKAANVHTDSNKTNNLPELLQQSQQPCNEPGSLVNSHSAVTNTLPLLLQNLFVEQQEKLTVQPPDLLPVVHYNMEIQQQQQQQSERKKPDFSHFLNLDNGVSCTHENKPEVRSVGVGGVPHLEQPLIHHKNFNEISSSGAAPLTLSTASLSSPATSSSSSSSTSPSGPHQQFTTPTDTQLTTSLESDTLCHNDQVLYDQEVNQNHQQSDTETLLMLPSATTQPYEPYRRERSNSESEFESVESSIEEEDSQSQSVTSILYAADGNEVFGEMEESVSNPNMNSNIVSSEDCTQGAVPPSPPPPQTDTEAHENINTTYHSTSTTSTSTNNNIGAVSDVNVNTNNANGKSGPMSTLGCGSGVVGTRSRSNSSGSSCTDTTNVDNSHNNESENIKDDDGHTNANPSNNSNNSIERQAPPPLLPRRNMRILQQNHGLQQQQQQQDEVCNNNSVPPPTFSSPPLPQRRPMETTSYLLSASTVVVDSSELPSSLSTTSSPSSSSTISTETQCKGESKPMVVAADVCAENGEQQPSRSVTLDASSCADVHHHHHHPVSTGAQIQEPKQPTATISTTNTATTSSNAGETTTTAVLEAAVDVDTTSSIELNSSQSDSELSGKRCTARAALASFSSLNSAGKSSTVQKAQQPSSSCSSEVHESISGFSNFGKATDSVSVSPSCHSNYTGNASGVCRESDSVQVKDDGGKLDGFYVQVSSTATKAVNIVGNGKLELKSSEALPVAGETCEDLLDTNEHLVDVEDIQCGSGIVLTCLDNSSVPKGAFALATDKGSVNQEEVDGEVVLEWGNNHVAHPDVVVDVKNYREIEEEQRHHYLRQQSGDSDKEQREPVTTVDNNMEIGHRRSTSPCATNNTGSTGTTANSTIPIPLKTYGARNEVEVFLVSSRETSPSLNLNPSLRLPSTAQHDAGDQEEGKEPPAKVSKSRVHFSPVVSEISWRESYIDQSSDFSGSSEDLLTKLEAFEADLHNNGAIGAGGGTSCGGGVGSDDEQVTTGSTCLANYNSLVDKEPVITSGLQQVPQAPVVIHKVQMTSSLLHGGEDEEEDDGNHRNEIDDANTNVLLPIHMVEDDDGRRPLMCTQPEEPTTEIIEFRKLNGNITSINTLPHGDTTTNITEDPSPVPEMIYEDVNVEIEPVVVSPPSTLSMVPDLLTQCENANNSQTHIDIRIEENPIQSQPTKQILPKMFAEKGSEGKNNSLTSLTSSSSSKQKKATKGFSIQGLGPSSKKSADKEKEKIKEKERIKEKEKAKEKEKEKLKEKESEAAKENSGGKTKVGFFERLSKIRLSGGSKSKNKQKIHPKSDNEPQSIQDSQSSVKPPLKIKSSNNAVNGNGAAVSNENNKLTSPPPASSKTKSPILKKAPANSPTPIIPSYNSPDMGGMDEPEQAPTEAFDNILEEIAGLKTIKMRQDKKNNQKGSLSPRTQSQSPTQHQTRSFAERKQFYSTTETECPSPKASNGHGRSLSDLDTKLSQFKEDTSRTLDQISKSHPDLEVIEDAVKQHSVSASPEPRISYPVEQQTISSETTMESKSSPKKSEAGQKNEREWYKLLKSAAEKYYYRGSSSSTGDLNKSKNFKTGIVETDLDTGASREMLDEELLELEKVPSYTSSTPSISTAGVPTSGVIPVSVSSSTAPVAASPGTAAKARSLTNLSSGHPLSVPSSHSHHHHQNGELQGDLSDSDERAKSLEFLLDENHKSSSVPPENKLRLESRQLSEHELRIQRSLQRLNVPDWYKKHEAETLTTTTTGAAVTNTGANSTAEAQSGGKQSLKLLTRRTDYGSASGLAGGWAGLSAYKTPSLSSLHSSNGGRYSGSLNRSNFVRGRPVTMSATRSSRESLLSPSPASQSPSAFDRCSFTYGMPFSLTRFGHGRLSNHSTSISPASTPDSSLLTTTTTNSYVKKPYLGWRSQERLNAAAAAAASTSTSPSSTGPKLSIYLPPAERLANEILVARTKNLVSNKPTGNDRPPLPKPPPRAEKTALTPTTPTTNINPTASTLQTFSSPNNHPTSSSETSPQTNSTTVAPINNTLRDDRMKRLAPDVHDSIREVTKAINQFVEYGEEEQPKPKPRQKSGKKPAVWMESSFVGRKPL